METVSIPIQSRLRARAEALQLLVNLTGGAVLVESGWRLFGEGRLMLGGVALLAVVAFAVATIHTLRFGGGDHSIGWANLFAGFVVLLTSLVTALGNSDHISRAGVASGIVLVAMGIFNSRIELRKLRHHSLNLDGEGLCWKVSRVRHIQAAWQEIAGLEVVNDHLVLTTRKDRRRRIGLKDLVNRHELLEALAKHAAANGITLTAEPEHEATLSPG